ncbi:MAG: energy transducer TonB [Flavobacteriaceae bacterium]
MIPKKNAQNDLTRNSGVYFAIGLFLVMALTYVALEWKSFYENDFQKIGQPIEPEPIDVAPLIQWKKPPPPPPPVAPPVIEIAPDDPQIIETDMGSTETDQNHGIIKVSEVNYEEVEEDLPIPISAVEVVPIFPGCENESDKLACFKRMITKHIKKTLRYPDISQEMGVQGRVNVLFTIQKDGSIGEVKMRGPDANLEKEALRIIDRLPKMTPGKQSGRPVRVPFSMPITFQLQ